MERSALHSLAISKTPSNRARQRTAVRNGDRAMVVFLGDSLHLTAAVTCLDHGAEGDVIRVRSQDGHIFRARISGPGILEVLPQ
jgi:flagella basal body P-ring formation protein FlgA